MNTETTTEALTTGDRVQHVTTAKVGTVTKVGTVSASGAYNVRVAWDGSRASVVYAASVRRVR